MALIDKFKVVIDCHPEGRPDWNRLESAKRELFERICSDKRFPSAGYILDIGSGNKGSDFVNRYALHYPEMVSIYLDHLKCQVDELDKQNKVLASATDIPFLDEKFDIAFDGGVIPFGILKESWVGEKISYDIVKETYRVLKQGGLFVFNHVPGGIGYALENDHKTLANLAEIGFKDLDHLQRTLWAEGVPTDTYVVRK